MRMLATIRFVEEIKCIPDATAICAYRVGGWWVVDAIGKYRVGDIVVYIEPDAWVPTQIAPFLSKGNEPREYNGIKGERLRNVKLRGQLSQGLLLPIDCLANYGIDLVEGTDVSEILGIQKYDPPVPAQLAGVSRGNFPAAIPKTDEERVQNLTKKWDKLTGEIEYEETEKLEGSSMTVALLDGEFIVCSRNMNLRETEDNSLWKIARRYEIEPKMVLLGYNDIAIQGEIIGEGIQGNHYELKGQDFYVFTVYDVKAGKYLSPAERRKVCDMLGLKHVPVISECVKLTGVSVADVLAIADGYSALNPKKLREGIVFKAIDGQEHFKAVSNKYLLKTGG